MSKYEERLATKEALRDPYDPSPPEDEDEPSGILRRKLSVSFGNRFKGKGKESIQETISEVFADTPVIHMDDDYDESGSLSMVEGDSVNVSPSPSVGSSQNSDRNIVIPRLVGGTRRKYRTNFESKPTPAFIPAVETDSVRKRVIEISDDREKVLKSPKNSPDISSSTPSTPDEPSPPEGWIKAFSNKQNKPYWYNVNTKKSVWEFPKE